MLTSKSPPASAAGLRPVVAALFVCAMAGLVVTALFGFEDPNDTLLFLSCGLMLTAVVAVFAHLGLTGMLDRRQKRIWLDQLTGRRAAWAWAEYLSCDDLRTAASRFAEPTSPRR